MPETATNGIPRHRRISVKLYSAFSILIILAFFLVLAFFGTFSRAVALSEAGQKTYKIIFEIDALRESMLNMETGQRGYIATKDEIFLEPYRQGESTFRSNFDVLKADLAGNGGQVEKVAELETHFNAWIDEFLNPSFEILASGEGITTEYLIGGKSYTDHMRAQLDSIRQVEEEQLRAKSNDLAAEAIFITQFIALGGVALLLLGLGISFFLSRRITKPMVLLVAASEKIARGDLGEVDLKIRTKDELYLLAHSFLTMRTSLRDILSQMKKIAQENSDIGSDLAANTAENSASIEQVSKSVKLISDRFLNLDRDIENALASVREVKGFTDKVMHLIADQGSSISQSSAAIEQMIASIRHLNDVSREKQRSSETLSNIARKGEEEMKEMVSSMDSISSSANLIAELIDVINNVASQTNLLAMNAAIEAAHAGEQGKGFAVVADEIRKLAEATAVSAKDVSSTLKDIVAHIAHSGDISRKTGDSMLEIVKGVEAITAAMGEMTGGLDEMSQGTNEITKALSDLVQQSEKVKDLGASVENKTTQLENTMQDLSQFSKDGTQALSESVQGFDQMIQATASMRDLGNKNAENVKILEREISRFTL